MEHLSFDFTKHKLPIAYTTYGAAVQLHHKFNLLPDVPNRQGLIVMTQSIESDYKFEIDVEFLIETDP
jgi:hypothetical protein